MATGADDAARAAQALRAVLAEAADPDAEFAVSAGTRNRIEGAALALDTMVILSENDR